MSKWKVTALAIGLIVALAAGVAVGATLAGEPPGSASPSDSSTTSSSSAAGTASEDASEEDSNGPDSTSPPATSVRPGTCSVPPGEPYVGGPSVDVTELGESGGVRVQGVRYPRPDYEGELWTQWGQGLVHDGRFYSAIGDHVGVDGNSYLYEYDPSTGTLSTIGDLLSYVDHQSGSWGYGKVHGQIVAGSCGEMYFASYWGTNNGLRFDGSYSGDRLFRLDPTTRTVTDLGVPVAEHGIPSLAGSTDGRLVYGEAIDPILEVDDIDVGPFFVYDTLQEQVIFEGPETPHAGFRNIMVDQEGKAYYAIGSGGLNVYDPATNEVTEHGFSMPGEWLRASTRPTEDGRVFGVTDDEAALFVMEPSGEIESLGTSRGYTTTLAAHPDGSRFFYIPDAHGGAWELGAPLISVDGSTGEQTVLVELNSMAEDHLGLRLGGTYGLAVDPSGDRIYIGMNAGPLDSEDGFGEVVLLIVHLP